MPETTTTTARRSRFAHPVWRTLIPVLLVLIGVAVLLFPVLATQFNDARQRDWANQYLREVSQADAAGIASAIQTAHTYNSTLDGVPILDPWLEQARHAPGSTSYQTYLHTLGTFDVMARIRIPSIDLNLPIYHGTDMATLDKGVGHLYGTSLPVGGAGTHSVLTAHTALATATLFDRLPEVAVGATVFIDVYGQTLAYQVRSIEVVEPTQIETLKKIPGQDWITLVTCTPYAVNTHRLLVHAQRVEYQAATDPTPDGHRTSTSLQPWMWWSIAGASAGLGLLIIAALIDFSRRRRRRIAQSTSPD